MCANWPTNGENPVVTHLLGIVLQGPWWSRANIATPSFLLSNWNFNVYGLPLWIICTATWRAAQLAYKKYFLNRILLCRKTAATSKRVVWMQFAGFLRSSNLACQGVHHLHETSISCLQYLLSYDNCYAGGSLSETVRESRTLEREKIYLPAETVLLTGLLSEPKTGWNRTSRKTTTICLIKLKFLYDLQR